MILEVIIITYFELMKKFMLRKIRLIFIIVFVFICVKNWAQGYELGGWLGTSNYFGDLNTQFNVTHPGVSGGINVRYLFNDRIAFKSSINYGRIYADDKYSDNPFEKKRNLNFHSNLYDWNNQLEFNFIPYVHGTKTNFFSPYLALGLSIFNFNPTTILGNQKYNLREFGTEGQPPGEEYYQFATAITTAFGMKWDISPIWSINLELNYKFTSTDYLDDVSTTYPNVGELNSIRGEVGVKLSNRSTESGYALQGKQRGNSRDNDKYLFTGISLMYYFGRLDCPSINRYGFK